MTVNRRQHFEAVSIDEVHAFVQRLRRAEGMSAHALELAMLTASRTGVVRTAEWAEIDVHAKTWSIAGKKLKSGRPHRVPLPSRAISNLEALPRFDGVPLVFPGSRGKALSDMALTATMRRMGLTAVHLGFRSTFADWCSERTSIPAEVREMALAHAIGDRTEEACRRGDQFEKRRELMDMWATFIDTPPRNPKPDTGD